MKFDYNLLDNDARGYLEKRIREIFPCDEPLHVLLERCEIAHEYTGSDFADSIAIYFMGNLIMKIPAINLIHSRVHL